MTTDVIIIGGGLVGLSAAWHAARAGAAVRLIERDICGRHASGLNAGGVRRVNRHAEEMPLAELSQLMWRQLADMLGRDIGFRSVGHVLVAEDERELDWITRRNRPACEALIDAKELRALCPGIAGHLLGAIYAAEDGYAHPPSACAAVRDAAEAAGATIHEATRVLGLARDGTAWRVETSSGAFHAAQVVNAAGAAGGDVAAMAGEALPIERQGPICSVTLPVAPFMRPVVQTLTRRLSLKQMPDGRAWIGGGHRAAVDGERLAIAPGEPAANHATAASIFPALAGVPIARSWSAQDGFTPDRVGVLGRLHEGGLLHACGFSGHGFQTAPAVGAVLAAWLAGREAPVAVGGMSPRRFLDGAGLARGAAAQVG